MVKLFPVTHIFEAHMNCDKCGKEMIRSEKVNEIGEYTYTCECGHSINSKLLLPNTIYRVDKEKAEIVPENELM